ncbi:MAG: hypothetical protein WDW36_001863 [Sanguina aurantia]
MLEDEKLLHYVTKDPIQNLRIRVTLTRISVQRPRPELQQFQPVFQQQQQHQQHQHQQQHQDGHRDGGNFQHQQQQQQQQQQQHQHQQQENMQHQDAQQQEYGSAAPTDPFASLSIGTREQGGGRPVGEADEGRSQWNAVASPTHYGQQQQQQDQQPQGQQQYQHGGQGFGDVQVPHAQRQLQYPREAQRQGQHVPAQDQQWQQQGQEQQQYIPQAQETAQAQQYNDPSNPSQQPTHQQPFQQQQQPGHQDTQQQPTFPHASNNSQQATDHPSQYQDPQLPNPHFQNLQNQDPRYQDPQYQDPQYQHPQNQDPQQQQQQQSPDFHQGVDPGAVQYGNGIQGPSPYGQVPTQPMDADAVMRALLQPQPHSGAAAAPGAQGQLPDKFSVTQVFAWQEKVYSKAEIAAAQIAAQRSAPSYIDPQSPGPGSPGNRSRRNIGFGSQSNLAAAKLLDPALVRQSTLFTYVHSDQFCDREEMGKSVTTSANEERNPLVHKMMHDAKNRQQVLNFRSMYIMADLGDHADGSHTNERTLVSLKAQPDGSLLMRPGFSQPGFTYKFEDLHGGIFEYTVENASTTTAPSLDKRTAKLRKAVLQRADELRRAALKADFQKPPADPDAIRLTLLAEIVSAADFDCDHLYVEYVVRFDPRLWQLETAWPQPEPGVLQGVTHISAVTRYPEDLARGQAARHVAHFCHPIELEWVSRPEGAGEPFGPLPHNRFPAFFFQVCHMDRWSRYTSEGYGWATLGTHCPSASTHYIKTWKPLGTVRDAHQAFFVGGSPELEDLEYLTTPTGFDGKLLSKYGFKTQTAGTIKVRFHTITQRFDPDVGSGPRSPSPPRAASSGGPATGDGRATGAAAKHVRRQVNVVYRARARLEEARGGEVQLRPGLVCEAPVIRVHPEGLRVGEGGVVKLKVSAMGLEPLRYQWIKDDKRLTTATADSQELILVDVSSADSGAYHCKVSNKDGSANSNSADLLVQRVPRAARTAGGAEEPRPSARGPTAAAPASPNAQRVRPSRLRRLEMPAAAANPEGTAPVTPSGPAYPSTSQPPPDSGRQAGSSHSQQPAPGDTGHRAPQAAATAPGDPAQPSQPRQGLREAGGGHLQEGDGSSHHPSTQAADDGFRRKPRSDSRGR